VRLIFSSSSKPKMTVQIFLDKDDNSCSSPEWRCCVRADLADRYSRPGHHQGPASVVEGHLPVRTQCCKLHVGLALKPIIDDPPRDRRAFTPRNSGEEIE
jgi:hypothetical protein